MAKRSKPKTSQSTVTPETMLEAMSASLPTPTAQEDQSRIKGARKRFADWAIKKALDFLLLGVIGTMTAPAIAIWLYIRSGRAAWTYPWLYAALGFLTACLMLIGASALLSYVKARRRRVAEQAANLKFVSGEKGWLDHSLYRERAINEFNEVLASLTLEIERVANTSNQGTRRIESASRPPRRQLTGGAAAKRSVRLVKEALKIASDSAARYNRHSAKMENHVDRLVKIIDLLIESNVGYMSSPAGQDLERLQNDRQEWTVVLQVTRTSSQSITTFRDAQKGLKGNSQELDTAVNRLVAITDRLRTQMQRMEEHCIQMVAIIDAKLAKIVSDKVSE